MGHLEDMQPLEATNVPDLGMKFARIDQVKSLLAYDVLFYTVAREAIGKAIAIT